MSSIMFQGTGSNVGKSILVAGICRIAKRRGISVVPFKPQNMSNNATVTKLNKEMSRAQAFQSFASGVDPHADMNPVLLKPDNNSFTQVLVQGNLFATIESKDYNNLKKKLIRYVLDSYFRLLNSYDLVIVEGAGSPAEINLRKYDIANMGFARAANVPVILIGDINRGGIIPQILGTKNVLSKLDNNTIKGFIVNKFQGNVNLFTDGYEYLLKKTNWNGYGILPWFEDAKYFPSEDTYEIKSSLKPKKIKVVCLCLPRISNFDDLDPLSQEENVSLIMLKEGEPIPGDAKLVIIPGTKSTLLDLEFLRKQKWDIDLKAHHNRGNFILGICGGYQILGEEIYNFSGLEQGPNSSLGLGFLKVKTTLLEKKTLTTVKAKHINTGIEFEGYEIHLGITTGRDCKNPFAKIGNKFDGAISKDGLIIGSYLHGMFINDDFRKSFLREMGINVKNSFYINRLNEKLDNFSKFIEEHININQIFDAALEHK